MKSANPERGKLNQTIQWFSTTKVQGKPKERGEGGIYVLKLIGCTFGQDGVRETTYTFPLGKKPK